MYNADTPPKAPRQCKYTIRPLGNKRQNRLKPIRLYRIHLMRRFRCFVFDNQLEVAKFLRRQNQSVQLRLLCIYVRPTSALRAFGMGLDGTKLALLH